MKPDAARLYRMHAAALFRYLVRMTGEEATAEDVLQDTFRRLLERPPENATNLRAWLYRVATNRLRDVRRSSRRRERRAHASPSDGAVADPPPSPDRRAMALETRRRVRRALDRLPPRDRTVLLMREEGFTHREIAEAVGTTTGSVGTLVARALRRFHDALQEIDR